MNKKLILLQDNYYVIDDSKIKENDLVYDIEENVIYQVKKDMIGNFLLSCRKITHSTKQLDNIILLNKNEIEEIIYGYSTEKLVEQKLELEIKLKNIRPSETLMYSVGLEDGIKLYQELIKDKISLKEIEGALKELAKPQYKFDIQTTFKDLLYMQKKTEWNISILEKNKIILIS